MGGALDRSRMPRLSRVLLMSLFSDDNCDYAYVLSDKCDRSRLNAGPCSPIDVCRRFITVITCGFSTQQMPIGPAEQCLPSDDGR